MHPNEALLRRLFTALNAQDHEAMASCYHPAASFRDIAFELEGRQRIHAMWHMIAVRSKVKATVTEVRADDRTGAVDLVDEYIYSETGNPVVNPIHSEFVFRDGLIAEHRDTCDALKWGLQALGPVKGVISWIIPSIRRAKAKEKLDSFLAGKPA